MMFRAKDAAAAGAINIFEQLYGVPRVPSFASTWRAVNMLLIESGHSAATIGEIEPFRDVHINTGPRGAQVWTAEEIAVHILRARRELSSRGGVGARR